MAAPLSLHDRAILRAIFNPSLPIAEAYDETAEELRDIDRVTVSGSERHEAAKSKQMAAIEMAERTQDFQGALALLDEAIDLVAERPSLFNDRAQILQFLGRFDDAFDDLSRAIRMADEQGDQQRSLCAALCQRGLIHRKFNRIGMARQDYERAAQMGSKFARSQLVEINPYAAMCNQMLRQVMQELQ